MASVDALVSPRVHVGRALRDEVIDHLEKAVCDRGSSAPHRVAEDDDSEILFGIEERLGYISVVAAAVADDLIVFYFGYDQAEPIALVAGIGYRIRHLSFGIGAQKQASIVSHRELRDEF